jgi:methionyl-tRNA formyltransferase
VLNIAVLLSGALGLKALSLLHNNKEVKLSCVFTDNRSLGILDYCIEHNIKVFKGNPRNNKSISFLKNVGEIDLIFSINYLFIIEKEIIEYPRLYSLNIHGSILPKYRGRTPHVWAIINGEEKTGVTVHKIDQGVDTGDILLQKEVEIKRDETGADILEKYNSLYPELINETIKMVVNNKTVFRKQAESKATYFGKRTPDDGEINWNWSKERIRNWVRAQANPYPGAFTYLNNEKLIINKVDFSGMGYSYNMENGKVLSDTPLIVKTPNGALELLDYHFIDNEDVKIYKADILGK